jgi:hypothetical protein
MGSIGDSDVVTWQHSPKGMIGSMSSPDPNVVEYVIPAKPMTILFTQHGPHTGTTVRGCLLAINFPVLPSQEYEIAYSFDATQCFADVSTLQMNQGAIVKTPAPEVRQNSGRCIPYRF